MANYYDENNMAKVDYINQSWGLYNSSTAGRTHADEPNFVLGPGSPTPTVENSGCGPCCVAMALSFIKQQLYLPSILANEMGASSFMVGSGASCAMAHNGGRIIGNHYGVTTTLTFDPEEAKAALRNKDLVMLLTDSTTVPTLPGGDTKWTNGGHYILLIGIENDNDTVGVLDPGTEKNSYWFKGRSWVTPPWSYPQKQTVSFSSQLAPAQKYTTVGGYTIFQVPDSIKDGDTPHTHTWGSWISNNNGTHTRTCSTCGETQTQNCTYNDVVTPPTSTERGYTTHTCIICNYSYIDSYVDPIPDPPEPHTHTWGPWVSNNNGTHSKTCSTCGEVESEVCTYTSQVIPPTSTERGYTLYTCSLCGYNYKDNWVDPVPDPDPPDQPDDLNRGIKNLIIDFDVWKRETKLTRIGEKVRLRVNKIDNIDIWTEVGTRNTYTKAELKNHFGISYTSVNNKYDAEFSVVQSPLPIELGGTGTYNLEELYKAIIGIDPGTYDSSQLPAYETSSDSIELPTIPNGHIITAEARSEERGSAEVGDQGQASSDTLDIEWAERNIWKSGEVSFVYDRDIKEFTNVYRLMAPNDPTLNALYKQLALMAANHACYMCQNRNIGYNFTTQNQSQLWTYITASKAAGTPIQFGIFTTPGDTNCINLCKLVYAAVMYDAANTVNKANFATFWTTNGILSSHILENLGFTKLGQSYATVANNLEIGDILIKPGHAAMVVGVGGKDWKVGSHDYNPKYGEVKT